MLQFVENDRDLPKPLNTASKQEKKAKELAAIHLNKKAGKVHGPGMQGYLSRTRIVQMADYTRIVIQSRIEPLDVHVFQKARQLFGEVVPEITQLRDENLEALGLHIYAMSYMPGKNWFRVDDQDVESRVKIASSLGAILGHGLTSEDSTAAIDSYVIPTLEAFRNSITKATEPLRSHVQRLIEAAPRLKQLPLYMSHHDLNETKVLIGNDYSVSGLVDWECSKELPFGMGLHRLTDTVVARNSQGQIMIPEGSIEAEKAFWEAVLREAPRSVHENLEHVQNAVHIGSLLFAYTEKHLDGPDPSIGFLEALLTYRLPQLRNGADPFSNTLAVSQSQAPS